MAYEESNPSDLTELFVRLSRGDLAFDIIEKTVDLEDGEKGRIVGIEVGKRQFEEDPPLHRAPRRNYRADSTEAFVRYAQKYGSADGSLIMVDVPAMEIGLCIDETSDVEKEYVTYPLAWSPAAITWKDAQFGMLDQEKLLTLLRRNESYVQNAADLILALSEIDATCEVRRHSSLDTPDGTSIGIQFTSGLNEEQRTTQIPTAITVTIPLLQLDVADTDSWVTLEFTLDTVLPRNTGEGVSFRLRCPTWDAVVTGRVETIVLDLEDALTDWTIVRGSFQRDQEPQHADSD